MIYHAWQRKRIYIHHNNHKVNTHACYLLLFKSSFIATLSIIAIMYLWWYENLLAAFMSECHIIFVFMYTGYLKWKETVHAIDEMGNKYLAWMTMGTLYMFVLSHDVWILYACVFSHMMFEWECVGRFMHAFYYLGDFICIYLRMYRVKLDQIKLLENLSYYLHEQRLDLCLCM